MQRRKFIQTAGHGLSGAGLMSLGVAYLPARPSAQEKPVTARQIVSRIRENLSKTWKESELDVFCAGNPETRITGIVTSFAASMAVLRRTAAAGKNMVIVREHPFYCHSANAYFRPRDEQIAEDPACIAKRAFIEEHNLVVWRFTENWQARGVDGQLRGLAKALNWEGYHRPSGKSGEKPYHKGDSFFILPDSTLNELARNISETLNIKGMRVMGSPGIMVRTVALSPGLMTVQLLGQLLSEPDVDAVVTGTPIEWEASPYFEDVLASGRKKGMILTGLAASEDPGSSEAARWLGTIFREIPVEWMSIGDPFWMLKPQKQG